MASRVLTFFGLFILLLPFVAANHLGRRPHQEIAHRARGDVDIHKRQAFVDVRFTWYDVGLGACGAWSQPSDFIVALNVPQYGQGYPGPQCFKSITIQYGGQTAVATIMDECEICPYGGLDFSEGLFTYFASTDVGVLTGTWWFNGDSGGGGDTTSTSWTPTTTWDQPTTTSTPDYTPPPTSSTPDWTPTSSSTPAYTPTTSTTSTVWTTSSATTSSTLSSSSTTSYNSNIEPTSGLAVPTGVVSTPSTSNPENILVMNEVLVEVGLLLIAEKHE